MSSTTWLDGLKVGDEVFETWEEDGKPYFYPTYVGKFTPTRIETCLPGIPAYRRFYLRSNGASLSKYANSWLSECSPENCALYEKQDEVRSHRANIARLTRLLPTLRPEQVERMLAIAGETGEQE